MIGRTLAPLRKFRTYLTLPPAARARVRMDDRRPPVEDPGPDRVIRESLSWLCRAQDHSASNDGGVARHYSLISGWGTSYPETTGYIVPTLLACARQRNDDELRERARRMLDWLVSIQFPDGGFQGGVIGADPRVPVTFNTGQVLLGLVAGVREFGDTYREAMQKAASWLVATQDPDGCWRKFPTPFAMSGEKVYETHVAWGLLEAARVDPDAPYGDAALANVRWALRYQTARGWFDRCCLTDPAEPLTHTLGYVLRGLVEAYRFTDDTLLLDACRATADGLLGAVRSDGFIPGRLDSEWAGTVDWACLTGMVQIAHCWLLLFQATDDQRYRDAAYAANRFVRRTIAIDGPPEVRGGVRGSYPVDGGYGAYEYLNWAAKFCIDANLLEQAVRKEESREDRVPVGI